MRNKKGFTIIEVALVLAIAGLIFLMVFVAVPSLRTQQRDTKRREDVVKVVKLITDYQSNHRGALPERKATINSKGEDDAAKYEAIRCEDDKDNDDWYTLYCEYPGDEFTDPDGTGYQLQVGYCQTNGSAIPDVDCAMRSTSYIFNDGTYIYVKNPSDPETTFPNEHMMTIVIGATCEGEKAVGTSNPRKVAILYKLEGAGTYCANS